MTSTPRLLCSMLVPTMSVVITLNSTMSIAGERSILHVYRYANTETPERQAAFEQFQEAITSKMLSLRDELGQSINLPTLNALAMRKVLNRTTQAHLSVVGISSDQMAAFWSQQGALGVLYGRLQDEDSEFRVRTRFFMGTLKGSLPATSVTIDLPLRDEEFDTTRDSHSAVTLYALAMDSINDCARRNQVMQILSEAYARAQVANNTFSTFTDVETAIKGAEEDLRVRCR